MFSGAFGQQQTILNAGDSVFSSGSQCAVKLEGAGLWVQVVGQPQGPAVVAGLWAARSLIAQTVDPLGH